MQVNNVVRELLTAREGEKVRLTFSEQNHTIRAILLDCFGQQIEIKSENLPREFKEVKSSIQFQTLLQNANAKTEIVNDGELRLSLEYIQKEIDKVFDGSKQPNLANEILPIVTKGLKDLSKKVVKPNSVLLVGRTGSGKSTLGNLLSGLKIKGVEINGREKFDFEKAYFPVGHSLESCTGCPNIHSPKDKDFTFIDCPGFDDARGPVVDISNSFFRKKILEKVEGMKIVLVVNYYDIIHRGNNLPETINELLKLLGFENPQDVSKMKNFADSVSLVVSHVPVNATKEQIKNDLDQYAKGVNQNLLKSGQMLLTRIVGNAKWDIFSEPVPPYETSYKPYGDKGRILELIDKSTYFKKSEASIHAEVSEKHQGKVQRAISFLMRNIKRSFGSKILNQIRANLKESYANFKSKEEIVAYQKEFEKLSQSSNGRTLEEFVVALKLNKAFVKEARGLDESLRFLIDLLPRNEKSVYPLRRNWVKGFDFEHPLQVYNRRFLKMVEDAQIIDKGTTIILKGHFPRMSQITQVLKNRQNIEKIEIQGFHTLILDDNLEGENLKGVNVSIIAPNWDIKGDRRIVLSGKDCSVTLPPRTENGAPGAHGLPGKNGGHFVGFGHSFKNLEKLTLISNGGHGGRGQDGARGHDGANGVNGNQTTTHGNHLQDILAASLPGWETKTILPSPSQGIHYIELKNSGKEGTRGGAGGAGGAGGIGGYPGNIELISLADRTICPIKRNSGANGQPGTTAISGLGGRKGQDWSGRWKFTEGRTETWTDFMDVVVQDYITIPAHFILGLPVPEVRIPNGSHIEKRPVPKSRVIPPQSEWEEVPHFGGYGPRIENGHQPSTKNCTGQQYPEQFKPLRLNDSLNQFRATVMTEGNFIVSRVFERFLRECDNHIRVKENESVENFIHECEEMENLLTHIKDKSKTLPLYQAMLARIYALRERQGIEKGHVDNDVVCSLHSYIFSMIALIKGGEDRRLALDINDHLEELHRNIDLFQKDPVHQLGKSFEKLSHEIKDEKEKIWFLKNMGKIFSSKSDQRIEAYKQKVLRNLILEQYHRALAAVQQWAFPFASEYLKDFQPLYHLATQGTYDELKAQVNDKIKKLRTKVISYHTKDNRERGTYMPIERFSSSDPLGPFYIWEGSEYKNEINDLFKGKPVHLYADVDRTSSRKLAIKFAQIKVELKCPDDILIQADLDEAFSEVVVKMEQVGPSFYKYQDQIYEMSNGKDRYEKTKKYNEILEKGKCLQSPYSQWKISLNVGEEFYKKFANHLSKIQIHLVGLGSCVDEEIANSKEWNLALYEKNIAIHLDQSISSSSTSDESPRGTAGKKEAERQNHDKDFASATIPLPVLLPKVIAGGAAIVPSVSTVSTDVGVGGKNAYSTRNDPEGYWYTADDIRYIFNTQTLKTDLDPFLFLGSLQAQQLSAGLNEYIHRVNQHQAVFFSFNLGNRHWAALCLTRRENGELVALYKDSFGDSNQEVQNILGKITCLVNPKDEQVGNGSLCGVFTTENIRIMARELQGPNRENFINNFGKYDGFCKLDRAKTLRQNDFSQFYLEGERKDTDRTMSKAFETAHEGEADKIILRMQESAQRRGVAVVHQKQFPAGGRALYVDLAPNDTEYTTYSYKIAKVEGVDLQQMREIIEESFQLKVPNEWVNENKFIRIPSERIQN